MNKILIALILIVPVLGVTDLIISEEQILSYEIPPSNYLEKLATISEKEAEKKPDLLGLLTLGLGTMLIASQLSEDISPSGGSLEGYLGAGFLIALGIHKITNNISNEVVSDEMIRFKQIEKEPNKDKREIMSYNALVWFASSENNQKKQSRSKPNNRPNSINSNDLIFSLFLKSIIQNSIESEDLVELNTIHQRALNGFLTQTPLEIVF
tara:strand:- start:670 stop:1299 length:630 start_codon:yes stop_codon:yes gene_type:complete